MPEILHYIQVASGFVAGKIKIRTAKRRVPFISSFFARMQRRQRRSNMARSPHKQLMIPRRLSRVSSHGGHVQVWFWGFFLDPFSLYTWREWAFHGWRLRENNHLFNLWPARLAGCICPLAGRRWAGRADSVRPSVWQRCMRLCFWSFFLSYRLLNWRGRTLYYTAMHF